VFGGSPPKALSYSEIFFPTAETIAFHTLPPLEEPLDYDPSEANREMDVIELLVGTFVMKGKIRITSCLGWRKLSHSLIKRIYQRCLRFEQETRGFCDSENLST
jgi:hypothetical protein